MGALLAASGCASAPPPKPPPKPAPKPVEPKPQDRPPIAQNVVNPSYPEAAREAGTQGYVEVLYRVDESGAVIAILIEESEPKGVFDKAVVDALLQWTFTPAQIDGEPAPYKTTQRFPFELDAGGQPVTTVELPAELRQTTAAAAKVPLPAEGETDTAAIEPSPDAEPTAGEQPNADAVPTADEKPNAVPTADEKPNADAVPPADAGSDSP